MKLTAAEKEIIKREVIVGLKDEPEVRRIVLFGSFLSSDEPNDVDVAIFQNSGEKYLPLALKYRRKLRSISRRIPVDIVPIRPTPQATAFLKEIESGEVLYEESCRTGLPMNLHAVRRQVSRKTFSGSPPNNSGQKVIRPPATLPDPHRTR